MERYLRHCPRLTSCALTKNHQIEQFIESIFPTQDPKKIAAVVAANRPPPEEHQLEMKEAIFLVLTILGVLCAVGGLMVSSLSSLSFLQSVGDDVLTSLPRSALRFSSVRDSAPLARLVSPAVVLLARRQDTTSSETPGRDRVPSQARPHENYIMPRPPFFFPSLFLFFLLGLFCSQRRRGYEYHYKGE